MRLGAPCLGELHLNLTAHGAESHYGQSSGLIAQSLTFRSVCVGQKPNMF